ncbi:MAG: UDP-N-acetylmuramate dehydrogenase [Patescibacteria group bacterium]|jgi:UDP-N-acetylmuramate dehydrogenase
MLSQLQQKLGTVKENEPMANHTTFKIGGPAKYFYVAKNSDELLLAVKTAQDLNLPYFILGWGSNLVVADNGFAGLVIKTLSENFEVRGEEIFAEAGVNLSRLVGEAARAGLTGLEFASGIPGTVGGAARGNAGAYGKGFGDVIKKVKVYQNGQVQELTKEEMKYSYRQSLVKQTGGIILSVVVGLKNGDSQAIHAEVLKIIKDRNDKLPYEPSAGCIFQNIELDKVAIDPQKAIKELDITEKEWQEATAFGKLPIGFVIDHLGLKNKTIGGCKISDKHCAFFINTGEAKAEHVMMLISDVKMRVRNQLGAQIQEEVQYLGF